MNQMQLFYYPNPLKVRLCMALGNVHLVLGFGNHKGAPEAKIVIIATCAQMARSRLGRKLRLLLCVQVSLKVTQAMAYQFMTLRNRYKVLKLQSPLSHWDQQGHCLPQDLHCTFLGSVGHVLGSGKKTAAQMARNAAIATFVPRVRSRSGSAIELLP